MKNDKEWGLPRSLTLRASFAEAESDGPVELLTAAAVNEWYDQKHGKPCGYEVKLIDSLFDGCPYAADGDGIEHRCVKNGRTRNRIQRYLCTGCGRQFTPTTGTIFDSKKIPISEWVGFIVSLASYESLTQASLTNMNSKSTGRYWV